MTATYITTNTIGAGFQHTYAAAGDELVILPGVTLASTTGSALDGTPMSTSGAVIQSCWKEKGSNDRPSKDDA